MDTPVGMLRLTYLGVIDVPKLQTSAPGPNNVTLIVDDDDGRLWVHAEERSWMLLDEPTLGLFVVEPQTTWIAVAESGEAWEIERESEN